MKSLPKTLLKALLAVLTLTWACASVAGADEPPQWAREAAAQTTPSFPAKVGTVVLLHEESLVVDPEGRRVMRERGAVRILQRGATLAATRPYNTKSGRVRDFQGWLIPPSGKPSAYANNRIIDVALSSSDLYDESRLKILEAGDAPPGSVFVWEIVEEERTVFTQSMHQFQRAAPVMISRFVLTLPAGWEADGVVLNGKPIEPAIAAATSTWEMRNLSGIEREDYSPSISRMAPRLAITYYPPSSSRAVLPSMKSWATVSSWISGLVDPPAVVTEAVRERAFQLTANSPGELDKIKAIASFVQQTNYVSVALNLTKGGGYTPAAAESTLARNYGDCKDKVTLMRSLLKAVGVDSYLTTIYSGDRDYVQPEWPSPMQFNHAIVAVRVSDAVSLPTVLKDPRLGRLLLFDPTDAFTPVGDLPEDEQGSHALILAGDAGELVKMPQVSAADSRIESVVEAAMDVDGGIEARVQKIYFGQSGIALAAARKLGGEEGVKRAFERSWSRHLIGLTFSSFQTSARPESSSILLNAALTAQRFGQVMQGQLMIVRPGLLANPAEYSFTSRQRKNAVRLDAVLRRSTVKIKVPDGFQLDELPEAVQLDAKYGRMKATWTVADNEIIFEQTVEVKAVVAPVEDFAAVREFFDAVGGALNAPVVFVNRSKN